MEHLIDQAPHLGLLLGCGFSFIILALGIINFRLSTKYKEEMFQNETLHEQNRLINVNAHNYMLSRLSEIRRPLQGILGVRDIYEDQAKTSEMRNFLDVVDQCVKYAVMQIDRMQFYSEFESGKVVTDWKPMCLKEVVEKAVHRSQACVLNEEARVDVYIEPTLSTFVLADSRLVQIALFEALTNSLKHSKRSPVRLKVETSSKSANEIEFTVIDCGPGLSEKDIEPSMHHQQKGLGFLLIRQVMQALRGRYSVATLPQQGTAFTLTLALPPTEPTADDLIEVQKHVSSSRVLIVDDEPVTRHLMQKLLEKLGYDVSAAKDGREAVHMQLQNPFGVILMDLEMPTMNGIEASEAILKLSKGPKPHIVALTCHNLFDDREKCLTAGMNDFLAKPASIHDLEALLERLGAKPLKAISKSLEIAKIYSLYNDDEKLVNEVIINARRSLPRLQEAINAAVMANECNSLHELIEGLKKDLKALHCAEGLERCEIVSELSKQPESTEFFKAMEALNQSLHKVLKDVDSLLSDNSAFSKLAG